MYQLGFILLGLLGLIGLAVSTMWIIHIVIYMLPPVPIHPMLNEVFMKLDQVFPLFGVAAFAAFCCYLMVVAIKGNFLLGLNFLVIKLYPMRPGEPLRPFDKPTAQILQALV
jgi:LMBR1 domain-containing protein 1